MEAKFDALIDNESLIISILICHFQNRLRARIALRMFDNNSGTKKKIASSSVLGFCRLCRHAGRFVFFVQTNSMGINGNLCGAHNSENIY